MNLRTIEMSKHAAREAHLEYRDAVRHRRRRGRGGYPEDEAIMRAYKALASGQQIIQLTEALRAGGTTTLDITATRWDSEANVYRNVIKTMELPQLAIARADATHVWCRGITAAGNVEMVTKLDRAITNRRDVISRTGVFDQADRTQAWAYRGTPRAIVPTIPPKLRPRRPQLSNFHILFEAEWGLDPDPPVDPALLRHLGGDLFAVVAVWDLTAVERAVLAITR